ncbi:uncharacterized protein FPRO_03707 [Fusarium proliferatum ET1]|uniref:Uncharacterized protein n=1 Tax=Fusarium proliferatum (strain ET1) TaxID=1227346 RepID=A0A1L7V565_FUSPR|nr:uncharacterized protein FPRO_03707 [Fusarium proliferatum ET1]CZR36033.1 uncharacterized protein FPRO_03707 [Fusarium proliferatum ET1]
MLIDLCVLKILWLLWLSGGYSALDCEWSRGAATRNIIASLGHAITESPDTHCTYSLIASSAQYI